MAQRFYIGQTNGQGLQTDLKPFAIPDDAFAELNNAYVFRGRVRKRFGARLMQGTDAQIEGLEQIQSRLKINLGNTNGSGDLSGTVPGAIFKIGQAFSCGDEFFTVYQTGTPAVMLKTGSAATHTYNTTTGAYVIAGSNANTPVYFYPAEPVMGLRTYERPDINIEQVIAFDTQFAYQFSANGWERLGTVVFTGDDTDFFWSTNWRGSTEADNYFFVSNYKDNVSYYNGSVWTNFSPILDDTNRLTSARIILPFKGRLLALNTIENVQGIRFSSVDTSANTGDFNQTVAGAYSLGQQFVVGNTIFEIASVAAGLQNMTVYTLPGTQIPPTAQFNAATGNLVITGNGNNALQPVYFFNGSTTSNSTYVNRCRFSLVGNPVLTNGWLSEDGLGDFVDAPTKEAIVTAQFLKDRLIVFFESSTWELAFTNNDAYPFVWQKINTELGAESTFSQIPFDKMVLGVGNVGIHACTGNNVERIDQKIPDVVFQIHNSNSGPERVAGIRDYYTEMVYWSLPDGSRNDDYPFNNKVLTYNYRNNCWGFNDDSITAFGYFQTTVSGTLTGLTWGGSNTLTWDDASFAWNFAANQAKFRNVIAGNQEGYVFIIDPDLSVNAQSLQINNFTYDDVFTVMEVTNHNLKVGDYVKVLNCQGSTTLNGGIYKVFATPDNGTVTLDTSLNPPSGTYTGGGTLTRVTPINFKTKEFNFFANSGRNTYIQRVDFLVDRTENGECTVDFGISSSPFGQVFAGQLSNSLMGTYVLETRPYALVPFESQQDRLWHPVYFQADGEYVQFFFGLSDRQATDVEIAEADFQLHAMIIHAQPSASRLQ